MGTLNVDDSESDPPCDAGVGRRMVKETLLAADEEDMGGSVEKMS